MRACPVRGRPDGRPRFVFGAAMELVAPVAVLLMLGAPLAAQTPPASPANADCLACHEDPSAARSTGRPLKFDAKAFPASSHAPLACVDCHADLAQHAEWPHPETLEPVACATCHPEPVAQYEKGVHAQARRTNGHSPAATCADCHGTHDVKSTTDPASRTHHFNLPATCGACHGNAEIIRAGGIQIGDVLGPFQDSIHGRALAKSGLTVAPNCADCHGSHDIQRKAAGTSPVHRTNVPATCGKCHEGVERQFAESIHGALLTAGNEKAPACIDCHSAHGIQRADVEAWRLDVIRECGTCHEELIRTYRDTFHGQVTALGFTRVATCADCHGSHQIQPKKDPRSAVSPARLVKTCRTCHAAANANFVRYDPHADKENRDRNPTLYYASKFMQGLLITVFAFFGIHTALWLSRSAPIEKIVPNGKKKGAKAEPGGEKKDDASS